MPPEVNVHSQGWIFSSNEKESQYLSCNCALLKNYLCIPILKSSMRNHDH